MQFDYQARIAKLIGIVGVDAVTLVPGANMRYFTGIDMHLSERPTMAIFSDTGRAVIVPELEIPVWSQRPDLKMDVMSWNDADGFRVAFEKAVKSLRLETAPLGIDGQTMRAFEYLAFQSAGATNLVDVGHGLLNIRAQKSVEEAEAMRKAIQISERALQRVMQWVKPGMTEREIADELDRLLTEEGATGFAFRALVQTGPNSAVPHGHAGNRVLQEGEFLLIDFGGLWDGYPADITRTFVLGNATEEMRKIYQAVLDANRAAIALCKPGVKSGEVDRAARAVIEAAGYGEYFFHRTGHGLGLEVHEQPNISPNNETVLQAGNVFTIEPGIYVPGLGGVRIEDNIFITEDGADVLTSYPKEMNW